MAQPDELGALFDNSSGTDLFTNASGDLSGVSSKIMTAWLIQLFTDLTNYTAESKLPDDPRLELLQAALLKVLAESAAMQSGGIHGLLANTSELSNNSSTTTTDETLKNNSNIFFLLAMGIFVYFMQSGFALMEIGLVRAKNAANSIWKNVFYSFSSALGYWLFGMALSFGATEHRFAGSTFWAFRDLPSATGQGPDLMYFFFEYCFCTTCGAIMTCAIAERAQVICYVIYTFLTASFTYPIAVHWSWTDEGWLKKGSLYTIDGKEVRIGFEDFAGSAVVHSCGGAAALIAIIFLGPRIGRFTKDGKVNEIKGHSLSSVAMGAMTIFTGFVAFNAGSELAISNAKDAVPINRAAVNSIIAGTGGFLGVSMLSRILSKRWLVIPMLCGGLAGNVATCCSCNAVEPWAAFCIGIVAGFNYYFISWALVKVKIDDAGDVVGGGGFIGCVGLAFFKIDSGIFYAWDNKSGIILGWQLLGFIVISLWSASLTYVIFYILKMFNMVRVDPETELAGLDYGHGHESAYPSDEKVTTEEQLETFYKKVIEAEKLKYSAEYLKNPGWSHPVYPRVVYDLSWISIVRSSRYITSKRVKVSPANSETFEVGVQNGPKQNVQMHDAMENGTTSVNNS